MRAKKEKKNGPNMFKKIIVVALFIFAVAIVINIAPNYIRDEITDRVNLIINNSNITKSLKFDVFIDENDTVYLSTKDVANFFDGNIYYDNKYDMLITSSDTKIATLKLNENEMEVNGAKQTIYAPAIKKENQFYVPFSEMESVYNVEVSYIKDENIVTIDSLDREQKKGNSPKDLNVKYLPTIFSKTVDKLEKGNSVIVISEDVEGWVKIRTQNGKIGYVKEIANIYNARENMKQEKQIEGNISLVWDYFSEYASAPNRTGTTLKGVNVVSPAFAVLDDDDAGELFTNVGQEGREYIKWAHSKGYKVWPFISNNSEKALTSEILNDYKLRQKLINNIVNLAIENNFDGINIDFEYMNMSDKDVFSRFIIELAPRLREYGMVLSVDVTAPDGGENWSLCYDRNEIGKAADYVVFMAYDQYGNSSEEAGTTAGTDWVEVNIKKFIGTQEEVPAEKLILGMPFYTRLWTEVNGEVDSKVVVMESIDEAIPTSASRVWNDDVKQYYVEYEKNGKTYKMWIEDEKSISAKCDLVNKYNLAGAAYWEKGQEKEEVWNVISEKLNIK